MLKFVECIEPNKYNVKSSDIKMIKVWRAEATFLRCFEDLFDVKFLPKEELSDSTESVFQQKMGENIEFYQKLLQKEIAGSMNESFFEMAATETLTLKKHDN